MKIRSKGVAIGTEGQQRVVLELRGSEAQRGLPLSNFATFVDEFRRALRDFDRQRRADRTGRGGHPSGREELVAAFRLLEVKPGSSILTLEPIAPDGLADQATLAEVERLAMENLRSLLDAIESDDQSIDPAVAQAVGNARRALGGDGRIEVKIVDHHRRRRRRVVIDSKRMEALERRVRRYQPGIVRVSGRLHMIDLEPDRVGIRSTDDIAWTCSYSPELEPNIMALLNQTVWVRGLGQLQQTGRRGTLVIDEIQPIGEFEQTPLFTFERIPLEDLTRDQGITAPQGRISVIPEDVSDEELEKYLAAVLDD